MANLKEIRIRIASVQSTQKITSAMKMVSAAKLRRAQNAILTLRPYSNKLTEILGNIASSDTQDNPLAEIRPVNNVLVVLIASNKGLCGGFNSNIIKHTEHLLSHDLAQQHQNNNVQFLCIGKRVSDYVRNKQYPCIGCYDHLLDNPSFEDIANMANGFMDDYTTKKYDKIIIVYNEFKNAATQVLTDSQYLPIPTTMGKTQSQTSKTDYIFEPDKDTLYQSLIPKIMKVRLYKCVLDSIASEHGARMTAMHKATENANELIKSLNLTYNKLRQSSITNEIIEIVSGANALNA
ncbi:MAG: ATP synthase F1 subunit gamma [Bacteroidales bacterium]|nr:ATP synthase F1 subunit gamma [Bacteroidales bacterium]